MQYNTRIIIILAKWRPFKYFCKEVNVQLLLHVNVVIKVLNVNNMSNQHFISTKQSEKPHHR